MFSLLHRVCVIFFVSCISLSAWAVSVKSAYFSPSSVAYNGSSTLKWSSSSQYCRIDGASTNYPASGSKKYSSLKSTKTVKVQCYAHMAGSAYKTAKVTVAKPPKPPAAPSTPSSISYSTKVTGSATSVSWGSSSSHSGVSGYELYQKYNSGSYVRVYRGKGRSRTITGLKPGAYRFIVRAYNSVGKSKYRTGSTMIVTTTGQLSISTPKTTTGNFSLVWKQTVPDGSPQVKERVGSGSWNVIGNYSPTSSGSRTIPLSKTSNATYSYQVFERSQCQSGSCITVSTSPIVTVVVARPAKPSVPSSSSASVNSDGTLKFSWGASSGTVTAYQLDSKKQNSSSWTRQYSGTSRTVAKTGFSSDYWDFRVRACNTSASCSSWRTVSGFRYTQPQYLQSSATTSKTGSYQINWSVDTLFGQADLFENGVRIQTDIASAGAKSLNKSDNGSYVYLIKNYDCRQTGGSMPTGVETNLTGCPLIETIGPVSVVVDIPPPSVPENFTVNASSGSTTASFSWSASTGNPERYSLSRSLDQVSWETIYSGSATSTTVEEFLPSHWYFRLQACRANTCSAATSQSKNIGITPPKLFVNSTVSTTGTINLSWSGLLTDTNQQRFISHIYDVTNSTDSSIAVDGGGIDNNQNNGSASVEKAVNGEYTFVLQQYAVVGSSNASHPTLVPVGRSNEVTVDVNIVVAEVLPVLSVTPEVSTTGNINFNWSGLATASNYQRVISRIYDVTNSVDTRIAISDGEIDNNASSGSASISKNVNGEYKFVLQQYEVVGDVDSSVPRFEAVGRSNEVTVTVALNTSVPDASIETVSAPFSSSVGNIAGQAGVNGGSASYNIPIVVPPGRNNVQPSISLNYSSRAGNGTVGVGWSLSAGSSIHRCAQTYAQDGKTRGVQYDEDDRLCLDGQRLIVVTGGYGHGASTYRTEIDSFVRVTQYGHINDTNTWFKAEYKDGRTAYLGKNEDDKDIPLHAPATLKWLISYQHDATRNSNNVPSNYIHYQYQDYGNNSIGREKLLDTIFYTGTGSFTKGNRKVEFSYQNRGDTHTSYLAGGKSYSGQRLSAVNTYVGSSAVHNFTLGYKEGGSQTSSRSLLDWIQECGFDLSGNRLCTPVSSLDWYESQNIAEPAALILGGEQPYRGVNFLHHVMPQGDMDGDGTRDFPGINTNAEQQNTGTNTSGVNHSCYVSSQVNSYNCVELDVDMDGINDAYKFVGTYLHIRPSSTGNFFNTNIRIVLPHDSPASARADTFSVMDVNGDGSSDLIINRVERNNSDAGKVRVWAYLNQGGASYYNYQQSVMIKELRFTSTSGSGDQVYNFKAAESISSVGDIDGNGLTDFVITDLTGDALGSAPGGDINRFLLNTSTPSALSFSEKAIAPYAYSVTDNNITGPTAKFFHQFIDVNGDGLADSLGWNQGVLTLRLNKGDATFSEMMAIHEVNNVDSGALIEERLRTVPLATSGGGIPAKVFSPKYQRSFKVADINGDGRPELLMPGERLVTACATINLGIESSFGGSGVQSVCGDDLYGAYRLNQSSRYTDSAILSWLHDDSVYRYHAIYFDESANGAYSARKEETDFIGTAHEATLIDAFGDGNLDMLFAYGKRDPGNQYNKSIDHSQSQSYWVNRFGGDQGFATGGAYITRNYGSGTGSNTADYQPVDVLKKVTNGFGLESLWTYKPLSSSVKSAAGKDLYHTDHDYIGGVGNGYFHFGSSMYVVQSFKESNGVGSLNETQYGYRGAVYNNQGRGFMGFRSIITEDKQSGLISHTDFKQVFPHAGLVQYQAQFAPGKYPNGFNIFGNEDGCLITGVVPNANKAIQFSETCYQANSDHASALSNTGVQHWYANKSKTVTRDIQSPYSITSSQSSSVDEIDKWGNVRQKTQIISDELGSYQTDSVVHIDESSSLEGEWWLTKVTGTDVTNHAISNRSGNDAAVLSGNTALDTTITTTTDNIYGQAFMRLPTTVVVSSSDALTKTSTTNTTFNDFGLPKWIKSRAKVRGDTGVWANQERLISSFDYTKDGVSAANDGYFPFTATNAKGHSATNHYDAGTGAIINTWRDLDASNDHLTATVYDAMGRPIEVRNQGIPTQYIGYSESSSSTVANSVLKVETAQAGSPAQVMWQDALGRTLRAGTQNFDSSWIYTDTIYNERGLVDFQTVPHEESGALYGVRYQGYDILGRPGSKVTDQICGGDTTTQYSYTGLTTDITADATGACSGTSLRMSRTYNSLKQLTQTVDAKSGVTSYAYNAQGNPIVIRDAQGNNIIAEYDGLGRKTRVIDPNQGQTDFDYNGFGELQKEVRAGAGTVEYFVDTLGRTTKRRATGEDDLIYTYDIAANGYGQMATESGAGLTRTFTYNENGFPTTTVEAHSGKTFTTSTLIDSYYGRPKGLVYPNGLTLAYEYNDAGYLNKVKDAVTDYTYRTIESMDIWGNVRGSIFGNGVRHFADHSAVTGQLLQISASNYVSTLHDIQYSQYDGFGNIKSLSAHFNNGVSQQSFNETYDYDELHRLTNNTIVGTAAINYEYDNIGNLTYKSDYASDYDYSLGSSGGPNAVKRALTDTGWVDFAYDARGNMTSGDGLTSALYNAMDKPTNIQKNGASLTFSYGPSHMRYKQVKQKGGTSVTTLYAGNKLYEEEITDGKTSWRAYIGDFALVSFDEDDGQVLRYQHKDRLGSTRTMTDAMGLVVNQRNYDPFGKPREVEGGFKITPILDDLVSAKTNRGFTGHEHLDEAELIHMNGRVYDYNLGRFMSVDPFIQAPGNSQSINPYSYVMNNPLAGVDPTGYHSINLNGRGGRGGLLDEFNEIKKEVVDSWGPSNGADASSKKDGDGNISDTNGQAQRDNEAPTDTDILESINNFDGDTAKKFVNTGDEQALRAYAAEKKSVDESKAVKIRTVDAQQGGFSTVPTLDGNFTDSPPSTFLEKLAGYFVDTLERASPGAGTVSAGIIGGSKLAVILVAKTGPVYATTTQATKAAKTLGFSKINETVHGGQAVYRRGKLYISRDLDGHNGGAWKMAKSVKSLGSRETRLGTFDASLNRIGN